MRPQTGPGERLRDLGSPGGRCPAACGAGRGRHRRAPGVELRFWARVRSAGPRRFLVNEWDYGGYEREIDLPGGYGSGIEARLANGQLAIRVLRANPATELTIHPTG